MDEIVKDNQDINTNNINTEEKEDVIIEDNIDGSNSNKVVEDTDETDTTNSDDVETETIQNVDNNVEDKPKKRRRKKRKKITEYTVENDIKYKAPLSYRHLRIAAWCFLLIACVGIIMELMGKANAEYAAKTSTTATILRLFQNLMMPLFLIATFSTILNGSKKYSSLLIMYGTASVGFYLVFIIFHNRYAAGTISALTGVTHEESLLIVDAFLSNFLANGYLAFNIFIDLFLCTLFVFFILYKPKTKAFSGKKIIIFRLFALIPILYEIASFLLKMYSTYDKIALSPYIYPLLTTKPPLTFVAFIFLTLFIKVRERIFIKRGKTHEEFIEFTKTKANSWQFSKYAAILFVVVGMLDAVLWVIGVLSVAGHSLGDVNIAEVDEETFIVALFDGLTAVTNWKVGDSVILILVAPFVLLFSYSKTYKKSPIDLMITVGFVIFMIIMFIEGGYQMIMKFGDKLLNSLENLAAGG